MERDYTWPVVGLIVVALAGGLFMWSRGPGSEVRAYDASCDAILALLDDPEQAVFAGIEDDGVEIVYVQHVGHTIASTVQTPQGVRHWGATVKWEDGGPRVHTTRLFSDETVANLKR